MVGNASGVWSASLWKRTIEPFLTLLVTLLQILSGVAFSFQSRLSSLYIKVKSFLSYFITFNYIIFLSISKECYIIFARSHYSTPFALYSLVRVCTFVFFYGMPFAYPLSMLFTGLLVLLCLFAVFLHSKNVIRLVYPLKFHQHILYKVYTIYHYYPYKSILQ